MNIYEYKVRIWVAAESEEDADRAVMQMSTGAPEIAFAGVAPNKQELSGRGVDFIVWEGGRVEDVR